LSKKAIILFNLGGPDSLESVQPFLFNLFYDPAIIKLPNPIRWCVAKLISKRRAPTAKEIYANLGGKSPLLELTREQGAALEKVLENKLGDRFKVFISMRYWHPMSFSTVKAVKNFEPDKIILLPLYPQFSTTTTLSSITDWEKVATAVQLNKPTVSICCYPTETNFIKAHASLLREKISRVNKEYRILFSAHGLPKKIIDQGDPYQEQVEYTAMAIAQVANLGYQKWTICYQSRVGPLEWIGPSLDAELKKAANDKIGVIVVPIAFVSEHSETLVELDIEYQKMARDLNLPFYHRVPALGCHPDFINALAKLVYKASETDQNQITFDGERICSKHRPCCPQQKIQNTHV